MKSILIVEDEPNISDFVKGELEYEGYDVCIKEDGREGLEEALRNEYDLSVQHYLLFIHGNRINSSISHFSNTTIRIPKYAIPH